MKTIQCTQGSDDWHLHRKSHFNASDCPAMLGISKYKSRSQLLREVATGITPDIDDHTQRIFDAGHRFEALARPIAEKIIGDELSPTVGSAGKLSASFDGITFDDSVIFEHKTANDTLRAALSSGAIPASYCAQLEQQMVVSGAGKCLFMISKWDDSDNLIEEMHQWYFSNPELRATIIQGWNQFEIDVANYQHVEAIPVVVAAPTKDLPALSIQVNGSISLISNLQKFGDELNSFVGNINMTPTDDQGFADAESAVKTLRAAQDALEAAEASALAQTSDIDDMRKTVKLYADTARTTRLMLEKMVKQRKESIRIEIVRAAQAAFGAHYKALELEIKPIVLMQNMPQFADAIKGKKTVASLHEAVDTMLRNAKMDVDTVAQDIRSKLAWCRETSSGYGFLFNDLQTIIYKPTEDFQLIVKTRISDHQAAEAAKLEAQRVAMQAESDKKAQEAADAVIAKAKADQDAAMAAERLKIEADALAKAQAEVAAQKVIDDAVARALQDATDANISADAAQIADQAKLSTPLHVVASNHATVIEHQDEVSAFMHTRDFGKDVNRIRAILVEFVKFQSNFNTKVAA